MIGYLIRRVIQAVIVIIGVCLITFILYHLFPGGAVLRGEDHPRPPGHDAGDQRCSSSQNGLNKPIWTQFVVLVGHVFTFNLGYSYKLNEPVATIIMQKLPKTVLLLGLSTSSRSSSPSRSGIFQVLRRNKPSDYALDDAVVHLLCDADLLPRHRAHPGVRHPLAHLPARGARSRPRSGRSSPTGGRSCCRCFTLAAVYIAGFSRYMRSSMMEALTEDYVRTARAKGLSTRRVNYVHAPAQRPHPDHHPARAHAAGDRERGPHHRVRLQLPGHGPRLLQRGHQQRLPAPHRHGRRRRHGDRRGLTSRRHLVRGAWTRGSAMCEPGAETAATRTGGPTMIPLSGDAPTRRPFEDSRRSGRSGRCSTGPDRRSPRPARPEASVASARSSGGFSRRTSSPSSASAWSYSCCCSASSGRTSMSPTRPTSSSRT